MHCVPVSTRPFSCMLELTHCNCREQAAALAKKNKTPVDKEAGFLAGGNSSCRRHIGSFHYPLYQQRCKEEGLTENHHEALPKALKESMQAAAQAKADEESGKKGRQGTLDAVVEKVRTPTPFSCEAILEHVTIHIVCGDHVSGQSDIGRLRICPELTLLFPPPVKALAHADEVTFTNCLVVMRPKTLRSELPTRSTVRTRIETEYAKYLDKLRLDIWRAPGELSTLWDLWTAPKTSHPFFGMILQWIDVDGHTGAWTFRTEVGAMHKILGRHTGANLGKYFLRFLDRVRVTGPDFSKVRIPLVVISQYFVADANHSSDMSLTTMLRTMRLRLKR